MKRETALSLAALLLLLGVGCASLEPIEPPVATIADLRITDVRLLESTAVLVVRIENANPFPLQFEGATCDLDLGGTRIGRGLDAGGVELPRLGYVTREVTVHLSNLALARQAVAAARAAGADYRLRTQLHVRDGERSRTIRTVSEGRLAAPVGTPESGGAPTGPLRLVPVAGP